MKTGFRLSLHRFSFFLLVAGAAGTLRAAGSMPFTLNVDGRITTYTQNGNTFDFQVTGTATSTPFGSGTFVSNVHLDGFIDLDNPSPFNGTLQVTFPGNNVMNLVFTVSSANIQQPSSFTDPIVLPVSGATATITGGTGWFAGASGSIPSINGYLSLSGNLQTFDSTTVIRGVIGGNGTITAPNYTANPQVPLRFVPITPCRVADTRNANGPFGGPILSGNTARAFSIRQSACPVPGSALAYSLNVTVVPSGPLSFLTMYPSDQPQPTVSTLNSLDGRIKANAAIIPAGADGSVSVYVTNDSHVILDINGYFEQGSSAADLAFYPVRPCRVADTRNPAGPFGGPSLAAGQTRTINISASNCAIPPTAKAFSLNVTVVPSGPLGYLTTWPAGSPQPLVSTLNALTGAIVANAAIVPAGPGGVNFFATNPTDLVVDINGYFDTPGAGGLSFYPVAPCRLLDTRNAPAALGGPVLAAARSRDFPLLSSSCQLGSTAQAYSVNATVVPSSALGYLSLWPAGVAQPVVSTLNALDGSITANAAIVPAGTGGAVSTYVTDATQLVLDVNGYFAP